MAKSGKLIITNGSVAAALLKINKAADDYLSWDDILHEGPVPHCRSHSDLTSIRLDYLQSHFDVPIEETTNPLQERDRLIANYDEFDRVELWFEHDLYDQLQLIQILDYFAACDLPDGKLHLIQTDEYLGWQTPDNVMRFHKLSKPVSEGQLSIAKRAWSAFRQTDPQEWAGLLGEDLNALPWLKPAVERMLEELPAAGNGLTRLESEFLNRIAGKGYHARKAVGMYLGEQPDPAFVGDWSLFNLLALFAQEHQQLIEPLKGRWTSQDPAERDLFMNSKVVLTPLAHDLVAGKADQIAVNGIDRWWGGTHLTTDNCWRWDSAARKLVAPSPLDA